MNYLSVERLIFERDDVPLIENLSFDASSGEIIQLAGRNGCGKTTLMRMLASLIHPSSGAVSWNGRPVGDTRFKASLLYLGHQVGVKLSMTPLENLKWYFGLHGLKAAGLHGLKADGLHGLKAVGLHGLKADGLKVDSTEVKEPNVSGAKEEASDPTIKSLQDALAKVGLRGYDDVPCYQLSAGQHRRVALARLYLSRAPLWLLDEPFTAIDKSGVADLEALIEQHADKGGLVVLTTHQRWNANKIRVINLGEFNPNSAELGGELGV